MDRSWLDLKVHMKSRHDITDTASFDFIRSEMIAVAGSRNAMDDPYLRSESPDQRNRILIEAPGRYNLEDAEEKCKNLNDQLGFFPKERSRNTEIFIPSTKYISKVRADYRCRIIFDLDFDDEKEARLKCEAINNAIGSKYFFLTMSSPRVSPRSPS